MNNSKPIKRHHALVSFSKDHHFGLLLGWKIRQGIEKGVAPERISNYVLYFFDNDLKKHFNEEESLLFSLLPLNDKMRKKAEDQHRSIYQFIENIRSSKDQPKVLMQLASALEEHIRFEERELFNHIQQRVSIIDLEKISSRVSNNGRAIEDAWKDAFWQNSSPTRSL